MITDVAQAYFELRELDLELEIAKRTRDSFQGTLDLFTRQLRRGSRQQAGDLASRGRARRRRGDDPGRRAADRRQGEPAEHSARPPAG